MRAQPSLASTSLVRPRAHLLRHTHYPALKAVFSLEITVPRTYAALSNMPGETVSTGDAQRTRFVFKESVPMSTYLLCYAVHKFANVSARTYSGGARLNAPSREISPTVNVRVWVQQHKLEQTAYALATAVRVIEFYEDYFGLAYPLPKQDLIAIPECVPVSSIGYCDTRSFAAGAMENWGLVTFRETALLFDANISSASDQRRVASVIAHELAHQYFGNLVTMAVRCCC